MIDVPNLGPCCGCERTAGVTNIVMLSQRCVVPGHGWGCSVCNLPADGASAVLCNRCFGKPPRFACRGYPATDGRIPISELPAGEFDHDMTLHSEGAQ